MSALPYPLSGPPAAGIQIQQGGVFLADRACARTERPLCILKLSPHTVIRAQFIKSLDICRPIAGRCQFRKPPRQLRPKPQGRFCRANQFSVRHSHGGQRRRGIPDWRRFKKMARLAVDLNRSVQFTFEGVARDMRRSNCGDVKHIGADGRFRIPDIEQGV